MNMLKNIVKISLKMHIPLKSWVKKFFNEENDLKEIDVISRRQE